MVRRGIEAARSYGDASLLCGYSIFGASVRGGLGSWHSAEFDLVAIAIVFQILRPESFRAQFRNMGEIRERQTRAIPSERPLRSYLNDVVRGRPEVLSLGLWPEIGLSGLMDLANGFARFWSGVGGKVCASLARPAWLGMARPALDLGDRLHENQSLKWKAPLRSEPAAVRVGGTHNDIISGPLCGGIHSYRRHAWRHSARSLGLEAPAHPGL